MEYVPEHLLRSYNHDQEHNWNMWLEINAEIADKYCCRTRMNQSYADLIYSLEYPDEQDKEDFANAEYNKDGYAPILLRGVIIDNKPTDNGSRFLQLVAVNEEPTYTRETILHLRNCASVYYTVLSWRMYDEKRQYTIGDLQQVKPGTRVVIAVTNLTPSERNKQWINTRYVDVAPDLNSEYTFVDKNHKIHQSAHEYLTIYEQLAEQRKAKDNPQNTATNSGCYIATAVYKSYDCPEVWTLRRYRDNVLATTWLGRLFIRTYYRISPSLVKRFGDSDVFINFWKRIIDPIVAKLNKAGFDNTEYFD